MSVPTESGWYWARLREPRNPKWEVVYLTSARSGSRVHIAADDCALDRTEDIVEWGPRIPGPKTLTRWRMIAENCHPDWDSPPIGAPT